MRCQARGHLFHPERPEHPGSSSSPRDAQSSKRALSALVAQPSQELCHLQHTELRCSSPKAPLCPHHPYIHSGTLALTKTLSCCCRGSRTICVPLPSFFFLFLVPQGPKGKTGLLNASPTKERSPQASGIAGVKL